MNMTPYQAISLAIAFAMLIAFVIFGILQIVL